MHYLGIDLGGTNIAAGVVDEDYRIAARAKRKTSVPCTPQEITEQLALTALEALKNARLTLNDIPYVGIGTPGTVNRESGVVEYSNNLFFENLELKKLLSERLNRDVILENDANAAAFGEYRAGALKGANNALAITLGTGVGSGIIIDGKIYAGSNFAGGEIGHTVIVANGRPCTCGRKGCWESYASATGLIAMTREAMQKDRESLLWKLAGTLENVDGRTAFEGMRAGDPTGKEVVDEYIFYLACGLANCINIFQPDILCIGGGISNEGESLMVPLRKAVADENYARNAQHQTLICRAQLGNDAGILGAALLGV
ncbi:glucokinase [Clostridium sp. W14A]|uniref:ROK family protein n=1 Tax=Caproicibacter fermentans TaxID=2576756 RepID=A0A7G8TA77_9FIRM|nr:ROK family protein [Caproicibacter fermentans]OCN01939.1 glucokinase [Clostridium sp. W14A]QNK40518.1 ROK family protein [Caproicibacter fermentans]